VEKCHLPSAWLSYEQASYRIAVLSTTASKGISFAGFGLGVFPQIPQGLLVLLNKEIESLLVLRMKDVVEIDGVK